MDVHPVDAVVGTPPYEQLRIQIAARVAVRRAARPAPGCRPCVRWRPSCSLAVNTVARVYRELEADGVVVTEGRRGTFVATSAAAGSGEARRAADQYAAALRRLGVSLPEAHKMLDQAWSGA